MEERKRQMGQTGALPHLVLPMQWSRRSGWWWEARTSSRLLLERLHRENQMNKEKWTKLWYDPFDEPNDGLTPRRKQATALPIPQ